MHYFWKYTYTQGCNRFEYATGLSIELAQTTYKVYAYINNINSKYWKTKWIAQQS